MEPQLLEIITRANSIIHSCKWLMTHTTPEGKDYSGSVEHVLKSHVSTDCESILELVNDIVSPRMTAPKDE